jgi:hypothetical protein
MTCRWHVGLVISALLFACGDDDGGDDGNSGSGDETPASDDFAPGEEVATAADAGTTDSTSSSGGGEGGGGCVEVGEMCTAMDFCSTWICVCNAGATELMTIGSCDAGMCSMDGTAACEPICANSGGVAMATDAGCS